MPDPALVINQCMLLSFAKNMPRGDSNIYGENITGIDVHAWMEIYLALLRRRQSSNLAAGK